MTWPRGAPILYGGAPPVRGSRPIRYSSPVLLTERTNSGFFPRGTARRKDELGDLAVRVGDGDAVAEQQLFEELAPRLERFIGKRLPSAERDDALQECLIAVRSALAGFRGDSTFLHFAIVIVQRTLGARSRTSKRSAAGLARAVQLEQPLLEPVPECPPDQKREALASLLSELPAEQALALELRALFDFSLAEIAEETGVPINTVRTRIRLARRTLRARIENDHRLCDVLGPEAR